MSRIEASKALYIKLGEGGKYEVNCIERDQTLRLGYEGAPHGLCLRGKWDDVAEDARRRWSEDPGAAKRHANQIRLFYETGPDVLWITFYKGLLWWCFSERDVTLHSNATKTRPVIGGWRADDIKGVPLQISRLSGKLTMLQAFRGTICEVHEREYLIRKINGETSREVEIATEAREELTSKLEPIVQNLHWKDFEVLVDLILRQAGWRRTSELGGTKETLDLELESTVSDDRFGVQVKSQADLKDLKDYSERVRGRDFHRSYFIVHSPQKGLMPHLGGAYERVEVVGPEKLAEWSVRYGLVDWVLDKAG